MVSSVLRESIADLLRKHGQMRLRDIYSALKSVGRVKVEVCIRGNLGDKPGQFYRVRKGVYGLRGMKARQKLSGLLVSDKACNRKVVVPTEKEFNVLEHRLFLRKIAKALAGEFSQDKEEIFSMAIEIAYDVSHLYDPAKGSPTTFLNCQVSPRLRNKITRELLPNIFQMQDIEQSDGTIKREGRRIFIKHVALDAPADKKDMSPLVDMMHKGAVYDSMDSGIEQPDIDCETNDLSCKIRDGLRNSSLSDREVLVVEKAFSLDGAGKRTLEQVGKEVRISKERVRQILQKIKGRLSRDERFIEMNRSLAM